LAWLTARTAVDQIRLQIDLTAVGCIAIAVVKAIIATGDGAIATNTRGNGIRQFAGMIAATAILQISVCINAGIIAAFLLTSNATQVPTGKKAVVTGGCDKATRRSLRTHISAMVAVFTRARAVTIAALLLF
jgi:hypothetical protein